MKQVDVDEIDRGAPQTPSGAKVTLSGPSPIREIAKGEFLFVANWNFFHLAQMEVRSVQRVVAFRLKLLMKLDFNYELGLESYIKDFDHERLK